jgi:hypothetical protein
MFELFKGNNRIKIEGGNILINNQNKNIGKEIEVEPVFEFTQPTPEIKVFENKKLIRHFRIETLNSNPNLTGQFLHSSVRVLQNSAVMIDGIISKSNKAYTKWQDEGYEAIRLQPFYLSDANDSNQQLVGKGLFERGLHFSGKITPTSVRNICICDKCYQSFTIQHFHAGFSEVQYFYSTDSRETLAVPYNVIEDMPAQLQQIININGIANMEDKLPLPSNSQGLFKYYNSFKCPHCLASFIDFEKHKEMRPGEYYGNTYINESPTRWVNGVF